MAAATAALPLRARAQARPTLNVKNLGAAGDGRTSDRRPIQSAIEAAAGSSQGATVYFPPGEYFLGETNDALLVNIVNQDNLAVIGDRATISCRSVNGSSSMLFFAGCRNVRLEGLSFRDYGLNRQVNWLGAAAIRLSNQKARACERIDIRHCVFDSVLSALVCRSWDGLAGCSGITLTDLSVQRSYYGFSFQDAGDDVMGRALRCHDVKRSYFPYGVSRHDIELDTSDNATGFTDILIKCYQKDTSSLNIKARCSAKRSGDAIVALDHQHEFGRGMMRNISVDLTLTDADCRLDTVFLIRSFDPQARVERETNNRWDDIFLDGDLRACERTKILDIATVGRATGRLSIGPRLMKNRRLPKAFPGFALVAVR